MARTVSLLLSFEIVLGCAKSSRIAAASTGSRGSASSQGIPFATPPGLQPSSNNAYVPSLGEIMQIVQFKHIKLLQAGSARNWRLAAYEVDQISDTFLKTAIFYEEIPARYVIAVQAPLAAMKKAAEAGDGRDYDAGFAKLNNVCNACHQAANVGFVVIKTPASFPLRG